MRILLWAEQAKMRRSKALWIAGFATAMVAMIVVLQGQFLYHGSRYIDGAYWLMTAAQSLGSIYVLPAMIALIGSYTICRERQEDTQKALDMIPVSQVQLLGAKMIWTGAFAIILYLSLFCVAAAVETILHVQVLSLGGILEQMKIYMSFRDSFCSSLSRPLSLSSRGCKRAIGLLCSLRKFTRSLPYSPV